MNIELERSHIIEELKHVNDEWILKAIKRLLAIDEEEEISNLHKKVLDERINAFDSGKAQTIGWEEAKQRLFKK